jgi:hypothetical protein
MSRGFGIMQRYLLGVVGKEPMTFKQILDVAVPAGTFDGDMARTLGASSISCTRSFTSGAIQAMSACGFTEVRHQSPT